MSLYIEVKTVLQNVGIYFVTWFSFLWAHPDRGLKFLKGFLTEVKNGEKNIQTALSKC